MKVAASRVLIADDEPHVRELLRDFLAGQGYEVTTVATGRSGDRRSADLPARRHPHRQADA
jgi:CheY-like chemotaxis protein